MKPIPIILDTDIGDDIDDALALAVAINSPEIELRGVTTVFGNAPRRAMLAQHILKTFRHKGVPVAAGCSKPLLQSLEHIPTDTHISPQFEVLEQDFLEEPLPHAVDFLVQSVDIEEEPDDENLLTIVPIGALTNVAIALAREPELIPRTRIVLMGGQWSKSKPEWNISCDPEAAAMVFNSGADITMIGLDVTERCQLSDEQMAAFGHQSTPKADLLAELIRLWHEQEKRAITLHDPLTLLSLFDDCVQFENKCIEVGLCGDDRGKTIVRDGKPNVRVAVDVNVERAVKLFMERVLG